MAAAGDVATTTNSERLFLRQPYASVFDDRIRRASENRRVPHHLVLGYAMAHEIGHLLLKTTAHSLTGIMRQQWDSEDERLAACGRLSLLPEEAEQIRMEAMLRGTR